MSRRLSLSTALACLLAPAWWPVASHGAEPEQAQADGCVGAPADTAAVEGATIGAVVLDRQPIFDVSQPGENKRLFRLANRYHKLTRASTIRSQLLFAPGQPYTQRLIDETERLLRANSYLYEATITPFNHVGDMVDLCIVTRDVWTLKPDLSFERAGGENEFSIELEDLNLMGTGAALSLQFGSDSERDSTSLRFSDPQLGRTRVRLDLQLGDNSDGHRRLLGVERPFFAVDTRWAIGTRLLDDERIRPLYDLGIKFVEFRQRQRHLSLTGGFSRGLVDGWTRRWHTGFIFDETRFMPAPDSPLAGLTPADRKLVYPFVGFEVFEDRFIQTSNHDQIGRTEDIYVGTRFAFSLGYSAAGLGGAREAAVYRGEWSTGLGAPERDLVLVEARVAGRFENDMVRNTVLSSRLRFYRQLSPKRLLFASVSASAGQRLDLDSPMVLGGNSGLRGYPLAYQNGESRALITVEQRFFTDWYPFRLFRVGAALFADVGRTWGRNPSGAGSLGWLRDLGVGLRLSSPRSSSGTVLHFDLAFPLDGDNTIDDVQLLVEGRRGF